VNVNPPIKTLEDIFNRCFTIPHCGCWIYEGSADNGKGEDKSHVKIWFEGRCEYIHRAAWKLFHGKEVPKGLVVDHLCKVRQCANPDHLEAVTHMENMVRGDGPKYWFKPHVFPETTARIEDFDLMEEPA